MQKACRKHAGSVQEARRNHAGSTHHPIKAESGTHTKKATFLGSTHRCFLRPPFCCIINRSLVYNITWAPSTSTTAEVTLSSSRGIRKRRHIVITSFLHLFPYITQLKGRVRYFIIKHYLLINHIISLCSGCQFDDCVFQSSLNVTNLIVPSVLNV